MLCEIVIVAISRIRIGLFRVTPTLLVEHANWPRRICRNLPPWGCFLMAGRIAFLALSSTQAQGDNVDFVTKFEKELRKRHHSLMTEVAKIEHLIDAFEKGAKRGAKKVGNRLSAAARKKISLAKKARWAKTRKAKATKG